MRSGTLPLWEDRNNWEGGSVAIKVKKDRSESLWMGLLLCVIGEQFTGMIEEEDSIQGVSINVRKQEDMLLIWNKRADLVYPDLTIYTIYLVEIFLSSLILSNPCSQTLN